MGKRSYLFIFFALFVSTEVISNQRTTIPTVVVTANKTVSHSPTHGAKTIITRQQMRSTGVTTLAQTLQNLGGVQLQNTIGNDSQVALSLRGFGSNASSNTLLLINGIPIANPDMAPPDLNAIPLNEIEYIEIMAGSESVLYGDQAVDGAINIVTRKKIKEKFELNCSAGSYTQHNCYFALHNHYRELKYSLSIMHYDTNNYRQHNNYKQNKLMGRLDYPYQKGQMSVEYQFTNEYMQYPGALTAEEVRQNRRQATNAIDFFTDKNGFIHLRQQHYLSALWHAKMDVAFRKMNGHGVFTLPFTQSRTVYFLKPQVQGKWHDIRLISGLDLQNDAYFLNSLLGKTTNTQQKYGLFGIADLPINEKISLSLGARGAQQNSRLQSITINNNINRALATTCGFIFKSYPGLEFYLRRAGSFRFPKADETASAPMGVTYLRTQRGIAYESGVQWQHEKYGGRFGIYQLNLKDEIAFDPTQTPEEPFGSNKNLSPTGRRGVMLAGNSQINNRITLDGQYNYVSAQFQNGVNAGKRIPLVSETILHAGINYRFQTAWNFYTEAVFTGNQYAANDDANVAGRIGGYTTYNAHLHYQYKEFGLSFRINNIFNKYYYFYTAYQPNLFSEFFYPAPGRNFILTMSYLFL